MVILAFLPYHKGIVIISTHSKNKHLKSKYPVPSSFDLNKEPEINLLGGINPTIHFRFTNERHNYDTDIMYNKFTYQWDFINNIQILIQR